MADNEATHTVDATEKNIREGYVEESQEEEKAEEVLSERERVMNEIVDLREKEEMGEELEATEEVEQEQEEVEVVGDAPIWNE